ncbi:MAG: LysM peptidoglycan-binding domain-containing protein [Myxococcales bacterium]|nr:LysM peptidoglycan-binding domain-containing protein [Myxococcales bacterium]MDH3483604.1 LysM peptidoglycan-binding domain-containing protein [Myxococcales bacterium]
MKTVGWIMAVVLITHTALAQDVVMTPEDREAEAKMGVGPEDAQEKVSVPANTPEIYTVREGDTLWDITEQFYGDPYRWPQVWSYNPDITNPHWIYPGAKVRLRPTGGIIETAPRGFSFAQSRLKGDSPVYMSEYGFLDSDALQEAGYIIAANEEHMMMADTDQVYVRLKEGATPRIGGIYTVYRKMEEYERAEGEKGTLVRITGELMLTDYDEKRQVGRATVVNTLDGIERGFKFAPLQRKFYWVGFVPADQSLRARVVASLYPRKLPSTDQIVFVDVGVENGVKLGNRFYIVRQGDEWRRSAEGKIGREIETTVPLPDPPEHYPWEVVAIGRAVNVQPTTTAILLERATRAVRMGDFAELREGE